MPLLNVTEEEWLNAKQFFEENPDAIKLKKPKAANPKERKGHSFIKVEGEIYAMANGEYLGSGQFGSVKIVQNEAGENYAVKIEEHSDKKKADIKHLSKHEKNVHKVSQQLTQSEKAIMRKLGLLKGATERKFDKPQRKYNTNVTSKTYTVQKLHTGKNLEKFLPSMFSYQAVDNISETQKLIIALKACKDIEYLHKNNILHCDIKPANFMADIEGNQITIAAIDFGFSIQLSRFQNTVSLSGVKVGSERYMAPEIKNQATYSKKTDIYALGVMLHEILKIDDDVIKSMKDDNPKRRPEFSEIIPLLEEKLASRLDLDDYANDALAARTFFSKNAQYFKTEKSAEAFLGLKHDIDNLLQWMKQNKLNKNEDYDVLKQIYRDMDQLIQQSSNKKQPKLSPEKLARMVHFASHHFSEISHTAFKLENEQLEVLNNLIAHAQKDVLKTQEGLLRKYNEKGSVDDLDFVSDKQISQIYHEALTDVSNKPKAPLMPLFNLHHDKDHQPFIPSKAPAKPPLQNENDPPASRPSV